MPEGRKQGVSGFQEDDTQRDCLAAAAAFAEGLGPWVGAVREGARRMGFRPHCFPTSVPFKVLPVAKPNRTDAEGKEVC